MEKRTRKINKHLEKSKHFQKRECFFICLFSLIMTCKPIFVFLEESGVAPTQENKKRWQAGWTISELKAGREFITE